MANRKSTPEGPAPDPYVVGYAESDPPDAEGDPSPDAAGDPSTDDDSGTNITESFGVKSNSPTRRLIDAINASINRLEALVVYLDERLTAIERKHGH